MNTIQTKDNTQTYQERIKKLMDQGFHKPGDVETRLGYHVGQLLR
jgi:hypothetical protein